MSTPTLSPDQSAIMKAMAAGTPLLFWSVHYREHIHGWSLDQTRVNGNACNGLLKRGLIEDYDNADYAHSWWHRLTDAGRKAVESSV